VNPLTSQAFISNELFQPSTLGVVNLLTGKVVANIAVGNTPFGVAVDLFTNRVLVTNKGDGTIAVVDGYTNTKVASVTAANSTFIEVNPVTRLAYASDNVDSVVHVVSE
jgi:YVTN family beta-propeller protein